MAGGDKRLISWRDFDNVDDRMLVSQPSCNERIELLSCLEEFVKYDR